MTKEKALELLNELLEYEERNDVGNLTRTERAEFQSIVREAFEEKEADRILTKTAKGAMFAEKSCDSNYPGIYINLLPGDVKTPITLALVECPEDSKLVSTYVYGDCLNEDYTNKVTLLNLEAYRKEAAQTYDKEADIWMEFYTTFNDDNMRHAEEAFLSNGLGNVTAKALHKSNLEWVTEILKNTSLSIENICEFMPNARPYVEEVLKTTQLPTQIQEEANYDR